MLMLRVTDGRFTSRTGCLRSLEEASDPALDQLLITVWCIKIGTKARTEAVGDQPKAW
jgi:hypothetical protein